MDKDASSAHERLGTCYNGAALQVISNLFWSSMVCQSSFSKHIEALVPLAALGHYISVEHVLLRAEKGKGDARHPNMLTRPGR